MFKKTLVLGSLVVSMCSMPTLAQSNFYKSGFLVGAHLGTSFGSGSFNGVFNPNQAVGNVSSVSGKSRKTNALLGVFGGYRYIFNEGLTIGGDVSANFLTSSEIKRRLIHIQGADSFPFINRLSHQYSIVPSINFGKVICNRFHAYLGLGLAISKFRQKVDVVDADASVNVSQIRLGFVPTAGIEYAVTHNVSIFGNVSYEIYKKISKNFDISAVTGLPGSVYASSVSLRYLTLKVGAVYRF